MKPDGIRIHEFLQNSAYAGCTAPQFLNEGVFSAAWSFQSNHQEKVIRLGSRLDFFLCDWFAGIHFSPHLPVPAVETMGVFDDSWSYAVSERMPGNPSNLLSKTDAIGLVPDLLMQLHKVSQLPVPQGEGFGPVNGAGNVRFTYTRWRNFLTDFAQWPRRMNGRRGEKFLEWSTLFSKTFLDESVARRIMDELMAAAQHCPDMRQWIHGDFGFDNVLADSGRVTAILDWPEMKLGDPLFDLAGLAFHTQHQIDYVAAWKQLGYSYDFNASNWDQRLRACMCYHALATLFFDANRGQEEWYADDLDRAKKLL
ncbi:MAG: aminoglycoside phosphotransferase family protein [Cyclobacteriaceae bacterium]|nr:aminoglycoside phosphotransferase family protein [Cyclobacteriaceae bacterium]